LRDVTNLELGLIFSDLEQIDNGGAAENDEKKGRQAI